MVVGARPAEPGNRLDWLLWEADQVWKQQTGLSCPSWSREIVSHQEPLPDTEFVPQCLINGTVRQSSAGGQCLTCKFFEVRSFVVSCFLRTARERFKLSGPDIVLRAAHVIQLLPYYPS
ncbi:hypothetical protein RRG08_014331 [Elysia crispata]|uniref:Uncharacterized protein n=1 Tax=Elysia crispata TaxID=231223 RepID=A0AAE0XNJ7_9GAST|nr:hypothetical protein RRG08_014331 [Elysia crispata]